MLSRMVNDTPIAFFKVDDYNSIDPYFLAKQIEKYVLAIFDEDV